MEVSTATDLRLKPNTKRLSSLKDTVEGAGYAICIERAMLITEYFKDKSNREKPIAIQKAEALAHVLRNKAVKIYPEELIVGSTTSKRVAGPLFPETHGIPILEDLFKFSKREVNPLEISKKERNTLLKKVVPFWINKFMLYKAMPLGKLLSFSKDQLKPKFYLINETGGIGHFIPDYPRLINIGLEGVMNQVKEQMEKLNSTDEKYSYLQSMLIICEGVIDMADNYAVKVQELAEKEQDSTRKEELFLIAKTLRNVPRKPAQSLQEAIQSIWMVHTAVTIEGLDNGISIGRMDQYLYPFYQKGIDSGVLTKQTAKELLGCFAVKTSEIIPIFSNKITSNHGGLLSGQSLVIGGIDKDNNDATNDLTYIFLELIDEVQMRQPNYHARIASNAPQKYLDMIMGNLVKGVNSPALYNDDIIIKSMIRCGYSEQDAREHATLGCVELNSPGKTCGSTDAALFNLPIILEMALNQGKLFGSSKQHGVKTQPLKSFASIEDVKAAYKAQLHFMIDRLVADLKFVEIGNKDFHPIPLTSALIQGCIESGTDLSAGGAIYNFSGVQGVGVVDTGDSIYALDKLVFQDKKYSLIEVQKALKSNFENDKKMWLELLKANKFGNDIEEVDQYSKWVSDAFFDELQGRYNTRGGEFIAGYYSTTMHYSFGRFTSALPCGRLKGKPFTSGIAPLNGHDTEGPTAMFNSIAKLDMERAHNGANINAKFDTATLKGDHGKKILESLIATYFKKGGMQVQLNVLDANKLLEAKENPEKYPNLLVRVSGYSAYFNDLSPEMKDEIIQRSVLM